MNSIVNKGNARDGIYKETIEKISKDGVCPFCNEHLDKYHKNPVDEYNHWLVTDNQYPYKPTKVHKLLIHKAHIENISQISRQAWIELQNIIDTLVQQNINGGTFLLRFGDTLYTGASVTHLHAHIIQSDPSSSEYKKDMGLLTRVG